MQINIPGSGPLTIETILLDLNGTLSIGGKIVEGVTPRIRTLREKYQLIICSGDTRGDASHLAQALEISFRKTENSADKARVATDMGPQRCAAVGNGLIDLELIKTVQLGIVALQGEGAHIQTLLAADIVVPSINDALDLFIDEQKLIATIRT